MRIVCISDTHNLHHNMIIPGGDVIIHSGDATMRGRPHEVADFLNWFATLPHEVKIFVPGNHDFGFDSHRTSQSYNERCKELLKEYPDVRYLRDTSTTLPDGTVVYGTPWVKGLEQWAFGWKSDQGRQAEFAAIPPETKILVTHGPAFGVLDLLHTWRLGDEALAERIAQLQDLKLHIHGHIHDAAGVVMRPTYWSVNAAQLNDHYTITHRPVEIDFPWD